jgi:hypothetical protein
MFRKYRLSVAPADIDGTIGRPGARRSIALRSAFMTSSRSGEASLGLGLLTSLTCAFGSPIAFTSVDCTDSTDSPGKTRQLMLAVALCGSALGAWPPRSIVATQVVPSCPTYSGWEYRRS